MNTLYVATRVLTFFGTEMRTFWELIVCRVFKIPAEDVRAFKSSELCGHVEHELTKNTTEAFFMCWFPLTMNFFLGCCFLLVGSYELVYIGATSSIIAYIFMWLGISFLSNCFPSFEDVLAFKDYVYGGKNKVTKILFAPLFALDYAGAFLERYSLTFIVAIAFSIGFPYMFSLLFPLFNLIH